MRERALLLRCSVHRGLPGVEQFAADGRLAALRYDFHVTHAREDGKVCDEGYADCG